MSEATDLCAIVLALCAAWLEEKAPDAALDAEVDEGDLRRVSLVRAAQYALAQFRAEGGTGTD